jgi:hypothetical protein
VHETIAILIGQYLNRKNVPAMCMSEDGAFGWKMLDDLKIAKDIRELRLRPLLARPINFQAVNPRATTRSFKDFYCWLTHRIPDWLEIISSPIVSESIRNVHHSILTTNAFPDAFPMFFNT